VTVGASDTYSNVGAAYELGAIVVYVLVDTGAAPEPKPIAGEYEKDAGAVP